MIPTPARPRRKRHPAAARAAGHEAPGVRPARQDRSRRTLARLLDAALAIVRERGAAALTVPAVAREARSSVGSFYGRFADKAALLRALHARVIAEAASEVEEALSPRRAAGAEGVVRALVSFAVRSFAERGALMLALSRELGDDAGAARRRAGAAALVQRSIERALSAQRAEIRHGRPDLAASMALGMLVGALEQHRALVAGGPREPPLSERVLAIELTRALLGYLGVRAAARAPARGVGD